MGTIGWPQLLIVVLLIVLLFGARRLPELARGLGSSLRIFKAETKELIDDDNKPATPEVGAGERPAEQPRAADTRSPAESAERQGESSNRDA